MAETKCLHFHLNIPVSLKFVQILFTFNVFVIAITAG